MSSDPSINAALFNMCAQVQGDSSAPSQQNPPLGLPAPGIPSPAAPPAPREQKDYEWLRQALASVESPERLVKRLLETMEKVEISEEDLILALEELSDMVEDINWATEFDLMKGPARVLAVLESCHGEGDAKRESSDAAATTFYPLVASSAEVRAALSRIIAHSSQLHERVQRSYADAKWEKVLLPLLITEEDSAALVALLHACSCLCRDYAPNTITFIQHDGFAVLTALLRRGIEQQLDSNEEGDGTGAVASPDAAVSDAGQCTGSSTIAPANDATRGNIRGARITNKAVSRICFFTAYLAESGVSAEEMIRLLCEHAERSTDLTVQRGIAGALLALAHKSVSTVSRIALATMPNRFKEWSKLSVTIGAGGESEGDGEDARMELISVLSSKTG